MWHWDQGHLAYFQFDSLRAIAVYVVAHDFKVATRPQLLASTGLSFSAPPTHTPWRQYSRALKQALLLTERNGIAEPTPVAQLLSVPGAITSDEYLHFLVQASSEPSPALANWNHTVDPRFPLLFSLKYLLAKAATGLDSATSIDELIGAYRISGFDGGEGQAAFVGLLPPAGTYAAHGTDVQDNLRRQARESLRVICQISYLYLQSSRVSVALAPEDASAVFDDLAPIHGPTMEDGETELRRRAQLFSQGSVHEFFEFPNTVLSSVVESGFDEGTKVQKAHVTIERNSGIRRAYFAENPGAVCDVCDTDTHATYPWTERILDLHHLLPLASGARVEGTGTTFEDLVPICPSCHRAVHRFYGAFFSQNGRKDFTSREEAIGVYQNVKGTFGGIVSA